MIILVFLLITLFSCSSSETPEEEIFARVGDEVLIKKNIIDKTGGGLVNSNSVLHFTNKWVKNTLLYQAALNANLDKDRLLIEKKEGSFDLAISNSFGFGGTNASLVFKRYN